MKNKILILVLFLTSLSALCAIAVPSPTYCYGFNNSAIDDCDSLGAMSANGNAAYATAAIEGSHSSTTDGEGDYWSDTGFPTSWNNLTVNVWFNTSYSNIGSELQWLFSQYSTQNDVALGIQDISGDGDLSIQTLYYAGDGYGDKIAISHDNVSYSSGKWAMVTVQWKVGAPIRLWFNASEVTYSTQHVLEFVNARSDSFRFASCQLGGACSQVSNGEFNGLIDDAKIWTDTAIGVEDFQDLFEEKFGGGNALPQITFFNMTSEGGAGCINWNTNKGNACQTTDTTPTVYFVTDVAANCAIGVSNSNYTILGASRNCTGGEGTTQHTCTLTSSDELVAETSYIYLGCKGSNNIENGTSTSGGLAVSLSGVSSGASSAIGRGVQNALFSNYTNYTNQQVYARKLAGTQDFGTFDWVAKKGTKTWAFNYVSSGESHIGLFNLTPVLYVLEMSNVSNVTITNLVEMMINATK